MRVNVEQAKADLSKLLARVEAGQEVEIARNGVPVARLIKAEQQGAPGQRFLASKGLLAGKSELETTSSFPRRSWTRFSASRFDAAALAWRP